MAIRGGRHVTLLSTVSGITLQAEGQAERVLKIYSTSSLAWKLDSTLLLYYYFVLHDASREILASERTLRQK